MASLRTFTAICILFCSVIHSAMAYTVYYGSWYLYVWIPLLIIAIIRCCCYLNRKSEPETQMVYVEGASTGQSQTIVNTTQMTGGATVVNPPQYQQAPPYYGQSQGAVINSAYTPGPGTAYPPTADSSAYPPPPGYNEAVKLPQGP